MHALPDKLVEFWPERVTLTSNRRGLHHPRVPQLRDDILDVEVLRTLLHVRLDAPASIRMFVCLFVCLFVLR